MIEASTQILVRFAETDAMGVVYHANYLPWCEAARLVLIKSIGLCYRQMNTEGLHLPVVEAHLKYKSPARFDDVVEITARISEMPTVKVKVDYEIRTQGKLLVTGHTIHVFVNEQGMPVRPPRYVIQKFSDAFAAAKNSAK